MRKENSFEASHNIKSDDSGEEKELTALSTIVSLQQQLHMRSPFISCAMECIRHQSWQQPFHKRSAFMSYTMDYFNI